MPVVTLHDPRYTKITRADSGTLYAYLQALPPVVQANRQHTLRFPCNSQFVLAGWRAFYFSPGAYQPESSRSAEWNCGAYLVQGLGHCNACHTSRDALGGQRSTIRHGEIASRPASNKNMSSLNTLKCFTIVSGVMRKLAIRYHLNSPISVTLLRHKSDDLPVH